MAHPGSSWLVLNCHEDSVFSAQYEARKHRQYIRVFWKLAGWKLVNKLDDNKTVDFSPV